MTYWDHHWGEWSSYPDPDDYGPNVWVPEAEWTELDEIMLNEYFDHTNQQEEGVAK